MHTLKSSSLPSIALWQGLQSRARPMPALIGRALVEDSPLAQRRACLLLTQLAALATMVPALRFAHYCRECEKLLSMLQGLQAQRADSYQVLLHAAIRIAAAMQFSRPQAAMQLFDGASLDVLRRARGMRALSENGAIPCRFAPNSLHLREIIAKRLLGRHCILSAQDSPNLQVKLEYDLQTLQHVAALEAGVVLRDEIDAHEGLTQASLQHLRLEIHCHPKRVPQTTPSTLVAMRSAYLELALDALIIRVCARLSAPLFLEKLNSGLSLDSCLLLLHQIAACLQFIPTETVKAARVIVQHGQILAMHLRCWPHKDSEGLEIFCLCMLVLHRQFLALSCDAPEACLKMRVLNRLARRVHQYIHRRRRHLCEEYCLPDKTLAEIANDEIELIHAQLFHFLQQHRDPTIYAYDDALFHNIVRLKNISLYLGEVALYEVLWGVRELVSLAIERQLVLTKPLLRILLRVSAFRLRCAHGGQRKNDRNKKMLDKFLEALRAQHETLFLGLPSREERVSLRTDVGKTRSRLRLATEQLPEFLAQNIRVIIREPDEVYRCRNVQEFVHHSSCYLLELNFLATSARALQVHRVAVLSEVMAEVYRALHSVNLLPPMPILRKHLQAAHCCLNTALNQAAARQSVQDVRPIILMLYHFLESLYEPLLESESTTKKEHRALVAVNALAADLRAFTDVFASLTSKDNSARLRLAKTQLRDLGSTTRQLQEDIAGKEHVHIGRLRAPLLRLVGRLSIEEGKQSRLFFVDDEIQAPRELVQCLQCALESLLILLLKNSVEAPMQRKAQGKMDTANIHIRACQTEETLTVWVEDDGKGLPQTELRGVEDVCDGMRGDVSLESGHRAGSRVRLRFPKISARWDIATKPL